MMVDGEAAVVHNGPVEPVVPLRAGQTVLLPADLLGPAVRSRTGCRFLQITIPGTGPQE